MTKNSNLDLNLDLGTVVLKESPMEEGESPLNEMSLFTSTHEETKQVASELRKIGCCGRCTLRFLGEANPSSYRCLQQDIESLFRSAGVDMNDDSNNYPCPGCLGILQKFSDKDFLHKIVDKVKTDGFSFEDYQCAVMLPVCLLVREKSIHLHLQKTFGDAYCSKEENISSVKDVWKWSCGPTLSDLIEARFQNRSRFDIQLTFEFAESEKELSFLLDFDPDTYRRRKLQRKYGYETFNRSNVAKSLGQMGETKFKNCYKCPAAKPSIECTCDITCVHEAVFLAGRYQKYSRVLSQTPWIVNGERLYEGSVEDFICDPMTAMFKPTEHRLSSSGREDVDVRMLGTGRPFVIELVNPHSGYKTTEEIRQLQKTINASTTDIQVRDLQIVPRLDLSSLKEGEIDKTKSYSAICWCDRTLCEEDLSMLASIKDLTIHQKTPVRVLHRRAAMTRDRLIYSMRAEMMEDNRFKLFILTQAGTYIKEFVHGDFGRTTPNLSELLKAECDITHLDVEAVNVDWPPYIDPIPEGDQTGLSVSADNGKKSPPQSDSREGIDVKELKEEGKEEIKEEIKEVKEEVDQSKTAVDSQDDQKCLKEAQDENCVKMETGVE